MSVVSDAASRLTSWIETDRVAKTVSALTSKEAAALQKDVTVVLDALDLSAVRRDQRLTYTSDGGVCLYLVLSLRPRDPRLVAVVSKLAEASKFREHVESEGGFFHVAEVPLDKLIDPTITNRVIFWNEPGDERKDI